mgnify:CR=1 FL=1
MNRKELVKTISEKANLSQRQTDDILSIIGETIKEELKKGEEVKVVGFGKFEKVRRKERTAGKAAGSFFLKGASGS